MTLRKLGVDTREDGVLGQRPALPIATFANSRPVYNLFQNFMKPKIFYIFLIGFLFFFGIFLFFFLRSRPQPPPSITPPTPPSITANQAIKNAIENSEVKDKNGKPVRLPNGDYMLVQPTAEVPYQILYRQSENDFIIFIQTDPFEENRRKAEEKLLQLTKTNQEETCKVLKVKIMASPAFRGTSLWGTTFPLSFCKP